MKKIIILLLGIFVTYNITWGQEVLTDKNNYIKILSVNSKGLTFEININDFDTVSEIIDGKKYNIISLKHESFIKETGFPELPKIVRDISIPSTSDIKGKVIYSEFKEIKLPVIPSKGILLRKTDPKDVPYTFDKIYAKNEFFPSNNFEFSGPYIMRNVRGSTISIYPFAYNPITQIVRIYTKLVIEVSFDGTNNKNVLTRSTETENQYFESIYRNHFINHNSQFASIVANSSSVMSNRSVSDNGKMLIITHDNFYNDILNYAAHKNSIGIPTQVVKMSTIGSTSTHIYNYIQNSYNSDNTLTFVLLVGDHAQVPSMMANSSIGSSGSDPSYSLIVGNDNYPDIIVGRFSAETNTQLATMINRSIQYDNMSAQSWFHKGIGIASTQGPGDNNEYDYQHIRNIRNILLNYHYTSVDELYEGSQGGQDASGNPTAAMVSSSINSGASIINYAGHGDHDRWVTSTFLNANVNALTNDNKLPFVFSVACQVGNFTGHTCFAETWLRATNSSSGNPTGAIAFYGSSQNQSWDPPMKAQDEFNLLLSSNSNTTFGALCYNASLAMISSYGQNGVNEFKFWNIFGDPSLIVIPHRPIVPIISGTDNPYSFQQVAYTVSNLPANTSVTWGVSNNATIISGQNTNNVTISICDGSTATLTATLSGNVNTVLTKTLYVNQGELTITCYNDRIEATYIHPYAQCYDWDISQNFINGGIINCGNQSVVLHPANGQTGGYINARARKNNCIMPWQYDYGEVWSWQPTLIGNFNPLRPEPLSVHLYEEVPNQASIGNIEYYWYFGGNLFEVTSESSLFTHNWPCGEYMFKLIVHADNKETSSEDIGFWGMCRGGRSSSSWSAAYPNPASNELIIEKTEEDTENNIAAQNIEKSISNKKASIKVLIYSHSTTKLVYSKNYPSSTQQIKIDTSKLPNGTYYLNIIENGEKVKEQTIIVSH